MNLLLGSKSSAWSRALALAIVLAITLVFGLSTIYSSTQTKSKVAGDNDEALHRNNTIYKTVSDQHDEPHSNITARQNSWEDKVYKGHWLACLMNAELDHVEQSRSMTNADLQSHGWAVPFKEIPAANQRAFDLRGYVPAMKAMRLDTNYKHWYTVSGKHPGSGGQYTNAYNPWGGILVADSNHGPDFIIKERAKAGIRTGAAPALKNWSDVVFLGWAMLCRRSNIAQSPMGLSHIFRSIIVNQETIATLRQAQGNGNSAGVPVFPPKVSP